MPFTIPSNLKVSIDAHQKWLQTLQETQSLIQKDDELQKKAARGLRLKQRNLPPEVLGGLYGNYCDLVNRIYQACLGGQQLQREPYVRDIISMLMRRLFELRNELIKLLVTDYIYLDTALIQLHLIPQNIEVVVPCHIAIEAREDSVEELLQTMWAESRERTSPVMIDVSTCASYNRRLSEDVPEPAPAESEPFIVPEEYIQATIIQSHERYRQYFISNYKAKCRLRRTYFAQNIEPAPEFMRIAAASIIKKVYRRFMEIKRQRLDNYKRDVIMGVIPDPWQPRLDFKEETKKLYMTRRRINERTRQAYLEDIEKTKARLIMLKKDGQIDDITDQIRDWFKEWYYGYGFFPEYPYEAEGGTIMVIRGAYTTIEEKIEADEKLAVNTKGKTKEMLKAEKKQAKLDAINRAKVDKENKKREAEQEYKMKCNPLADPGYKMQQSQHIQDLIDILQNYNESWSIYDEMDPEKCGEIVFGYIQPLLTEELMCQLHQEWRQYVDEFMRLELKLLIAAHKQDFKTIGKKWPTIKPRPKPPERRAPKRLLNVDQTLLAGFEYLFDLGIITKPTAKLDDIVGDSNYAAYECNVEDPFTSFPPPGYGDIRNRLVMSCVYGAGIEPGAVRKRAVLLLGQPRNGKSFLVDCVAGEINAVKIDISPEMLSAKVGRPGKAVADVFKAARVFQPCVVFMKNVERVFIPKVPPDQKHLKATSMKTALIKGVKGISAEDRIIFIATCSAPMKQKQKPLVSLFDEMILVPRADYNSVSMFLYNKLQRISSEARTRKLLIESGKSSALRIRSVDRDYCVQSIAQFFHGYGFGAIMETFNRIMSPERIIRLNVTPLSPVEFIDAMEGYERLSIEDYKLYEDFFIANSPLKQPREELQDINIHRADAYEKIEKKANAEKAKQEKENS